MCNPKIKGLKTLFKIKPTTANNVNPTQNSRGTIREWIYALE
jgi:hypothetical protein